MGRASTDDWNFETLLLITTPDGVSSRDKRARRFLDRLSRTDPKPSLRISAQSGHCVRDSSVRRQIRSPTPRGYSLHPRDSPRFQG